MLSPDACSRCNSVLPAKSIGDLCPVCRSAGETSRPAPGTPEIIPAQAEPITESFRPGESRDPVTPSEPFADDKGPATLTADPAAVARALTASPRSLTATGPDSTDFPRLPFAPAGYELLRRLGGGGMGDVYLAREHVPQREVAMKFLRSPGNSVGLERFLAEVRALARIDHPHIVRFITSDFYRDQPYFTMEYAAGGNLADRVSAGGPLDPREAARLVADAARAVQAAHAEDVLHRDLKPSNILLSADGQVKVSDFGLAKLIDVADESTYDNPLGTPGFMPPEQITRDRGPVGPASDVYGLGATLYFLLTGRAPFVGENKFEVFAQVERNLPDRPRALRPDVPASLEAVALKCLEKNPADRYSSAAELADELDSFLAGRGTRVLPLTPVRRAKRWVVWNRKAIGVGLLAVILALGLVAIGSRFVPAPVQVIQDPDEAVRLSIAAGETVRLLTPDGVPRSESWPLGSVQLKSSPADGGSCYFEAKENRILLLLKDPGVDSYVVRAEICQALKLTQIAPGAIPDDDVGLVLGYSGQDGPNGSRVHSMMVLRFTEYGPGDGPKVVRWLERIDMGGTRARDFVPEGSFQIIRQGPAARIPRVKPDADGRVWRKVEATVTPAGVTMTFPNGPPQPATAAHIAAHRLKLAERISSGPLGPVDPLPDWSPRMPIGIWASKSLVYVRNVTIEKVK